MLHLDVTCEEVCVCCFKVFRLTSELLRHAEKHADVGGRKTTYIKKTCDELREHSDKQLDLALIQGLPGGGESRKRKWEVAALGSETSIIEDTTITNQPHLPDTTRDEPLHPQSTDVEPAVAQTRLTAQSLTALPPLANMVETPGAYAGMSYSMDAQAHDRDFLQTFDAPILQMMNGVPTWMMTRWMTEGHGTEI
ncbi:hypothetical protein F5Y17DRAFT_221782 [Xylariaceae sp. FL0594]|nr:hypothetical protein F5Y17DRAFT_221782 [Xylariaceae sp. FL0594]